MPNNSLSPISSNRLSPLLYHSYSQVDALSPRGLNPVVPFSWILCASALLEEKCWSNSKQLYMSMIPTSEVPPSVFPVLLLFSLRMLASPVLVSGRTIPTLTRGERFRLEAGLPRLCSSRSWVTHTGVFFPALPKPLTSGHLRFCLVRFRPFSVVSTEKWSQNLPAPKFFFLIYINILSYLTLSFRIKALYHSSQAIPPHPLPP